MDIKDLVPGKLYKAPFVDTYFIFVSPYKSSVNNIIGHYFSSKRLVDKNYTIGNSNFWLNGVEASFDDVKDWMPAEFMPKITNYEIY